MLLTKSGILNSTRTNLGRSLLHTWLLRPSTSLVVITARLNAVSCFSRADNLSPCAAIHTYLATLKSIPPSLKRMRAGQASMSDWQGLVKVSELNASKVMLIPPSVSSQCTLP